jgi:N-acetylglucosaminyl-diphospho-decaprenol L-rhamnosyltransferase
VESLAPVENKEASSKASVETAAVILNYRTPKLVIDCLNSLYPQLDRDTRVVVVDNASGDAPVNTVREWIALNDKKGVVGLVESAENRGFAAGNNLGIRHVKADYYLLINSDTIVRSGAIEQLVATAKHYPKAGIVSPRLEWPDGTPQESCFRDHTPISELISAARTGPITQALKKYDVPMVISDSLVRPQWTSFACALLRRSMLEEIGLLDEHFFMYYEDAAFCRRARRFGWEVLHNPKAKVVHLRGGSSPVKQLTQRQKRLPRYFYESRSHYFFTSYGRGGLLLANLLWLLGRSISKGRELFGGRPRQVPKHQWLDIWTKSRGGATAR